MMLMSCAEIHDLTDIGFGVQHLLSQYNHIRTWKWIPNSLRMPYIHNISQIQCVMARNSTSILDLAIIGCFLLHQVKILPPIAWSESPISHWSCQIYICKGLNMEILSSSIQESLTLTLLQISKNVVNDLKMPCCRGMHKLTIHPNCKRDI